jgi:hypothetical protein
VKGLLWFRNLLCNILCVILVTRPVISELNEDDFS